MPLINNDIIKLLNRALKQVGKQTSDSEITYICPFHVAKNNVDRRKFGVDLETQEFNCFACGAKGRTIKNLFKKLGLPSEFFIELSRILGNETVDLNIDNHCILFNTKKRETKKNVLPKEFKSLSMPSNALLYKHAILYLKRRNITSIDILRYNIGYCDSGRYNNRIVFPSYDANGDLNFFSGRDFTGNSSLRYLNCEFDKNVIGFESLVNFNDDITLVEGPIDAITVRKNCVPLFGKFMADTLKMKIIESRPPVVNVLLDSDAMDSVFKISEFIKGHGIKTKIIKLTGGKDSSECGFEKTWQAIDSCDTLSDSEIFKYKLGLNA